MQQRRSVLLTVTVGLDLLCIHPGFQSRGAGRALGRWGTDLADGMNAQITSPPLSLCPITRVRSSSLLRCLSRSACMDPHVPTGISLWCGSYMASEIWTDGPMQMTLKSSLPGLEVYEKHGYRVMQEITLPVP